MSIIDIINRLVTKALALDATVASKLESLEGKAINLDIEPFIPKYNLSVADKKLLISLGHNSAATCSISGPCKAIITFLISKDYNLAIKSGLQISGDTNVAEELSDILLQLDIDWEEEISKITGDYIATTLFDTKDKLQEKSKNALESLGSMLKEYYEEELQITPLKDEVSGFADEISKLKVDVERLEARIKTLIDSRV